METKFPENEGYDSLFLVGFRKDPHNVTETQRTGTVILKRTYDIDPMTGTLSPSASPLAVFMRDQPDNLVINSDFESPLFDEEDGERKPIDWEPEEDVTIEPDPSDPSAENHTTFLKVTDKANGRVVQTLTFDEPLGGRRFVFSFLAKADATPARIENVQLEAGGHVICVINRNVGTTMSRFSASGTWPADLDATEIRVVLRMATNAARTVSYDEVQVEERDYETEWDPVTTLRYEHDLAAFKPEGDVIVLGFANVEETSEVRVNDDTWLSRDIASGDLTEKALFGWEPRVGDTRKGEAAFPEEDDAYPLDEALPPNFCNRFYNGYRRDAAPRDPDLPNEILPLPYLPATARIEIERGPTIDYQFDLRGDTATATLYYYDDTGPDQETNWQSEPVTLNLDTLVIEPEANRCYAVWRGVWPFDNHPEDAYRRLVVEAYQ